MKFLVVIPTQEEIDGFLRACREQDIGSEEIVLGRIPAVHFPTLDLVIAQGGLGKAQFAVHTQHLIDACAGLQTVICAGAAGSVADGISIGDVVVGTETVEHDIHNKFGPPLLPRFESAGSILDAMRSMPATDREFQVIFGPIASGDEDVVDAARRQEIFQTTGALAVAWEGAGGARASKFSGIPFVEIRGITDNANSTAASDFAVNLDKAMSNVAKFIKELARTPLIRERQAVRAILLTPEQEILLMRIHPPDVDEWFWIAPGGGIEVGETIEDALRRELKEELDLEDFFVGPLVWRRQHTFNWAGERICQNEEYHIVHVARFEPRMSDAHEATWLDRFHWWPVAELANASERLTPLSLAQIMARYLEGGPPKEPLELESLVD